jgi:hypothetical protein
MNLSKVSDLLLSSDYSTIKSSVSVPPRPKSVAGINNGLCYYWCFIAHQLVGGTLCSVSKNGRHAFLYKDDLFFDAEEPTGVKDWRMLPFFFGSRERFYSKDLRSQTTTAFISYWATYGKYSFDRSIVDQLMKSFQVAA